jgi:hypothetical protein
MCKCPKDNLFDSNPKYPLKTQKTLLEAWNTFQDSSSRFYYTLYYINFILETKQEEAKLKEAGLQVKTPLVILADIVEDCCSQMTLDITYYLFYLLIFEFI